LYLQGQLARFVHPSSGRAGASFDRKRFLRNSRAVVQLNGLASMLIACHFFGIVAGRRAVLWLAVVAARACPTRRFKLEPSDVD